jgi:hypothetical protein
MFAAIDQGPVGAMFLDHFAVLDTVDHSTSCWVKLGEHAFSVAGPWAFNQHPVDLKKLENTKTFKR